MKIYEDFPLIQCIMKLLKIDYEGHGGMGAAILNNLCMMELSFQPRNILII